MNTKRRTGRLLGVLLCLVLLLGLFPITAQAYYEFEVPDGTAYVDLYIDNGTTYYRKSDSDINLDCVRLFDGYCLSSNTETKPTKYTADTPYVARVEGKTLYLNGYHGKTTSFSSYVSGAARGIEMVYDVNQICVERDSSVTISVTNKEAYGIWGGSALTITGTGKLTVNAVGYNGKSDGIHASGSLTVSAPLDVTAEQYGIYTNQLTLNGNTDKTVAVTGVKNATVYGVYLSSVDEGDHTISGKLTVNLPTNTEALGTGYGVGIGVPQRSGGCAVNLTDAEVTITNGKYGISDKSYAKSSGARVAVSNSTLTITSTGVYTECYGINSTNNSLEITDGSTVNIATNGTPISMQAAGVTIRNSNAELTNTKGMNVISLTTVPTDTTSMNVIDLAEGYTVTLKSCSLTSSSSMVSRLKLGSNTCATTFLSREKDNSDLGSYRYVGVKEGDYAVVRFAHGKEVFPPEPSLKALYTSASGNLNSAEISKSATTAFTHQLPLELGVGNTDRPSFVRGDGYYCVLGENETITPATEWTKMTKGKYIVLGEEVSTRYKNYATVYVRYQYRVYSESTLRWSSPKQVGIFKYVPLKDVVPVLSPWDNSGRTITVDNENRTVVIGGASTASVTFYTNWPDGTAVGDMFNAIKMWNSSGMSYSSIDVFYVTPKSGGMGQKVAAVVKDVTIDGTTYIKGATAAANYTITCPDIKATYPLTLKSCTATVNGVAVTSGSYVEEGATVTVKATLTGNYKLNYWSVTGNPNLPNENTVTFTMPGKAASAEAILYDASEIVWWPKVPMKNTRSANEFGDIKLEDIDGEPSKNENTELAVVWYDGSGKKVSESDAIDRTKNYRGHVTVTCTGNYVFEKSTTLNKFVVTLYTDIENVTDALNEDQYTVSADKKTLEFDVYLVNLPQVDIPLYQGEALPAAGDCTVSGGCTVKSLTWSTTGTAGTSATISELKLERAKGTLWGRETMTLSVNETEQTNVTTNNSYVTLANVTLSAPVKPTGVTVSGTVTSYNPGNATTVQLMQGGTQKYKATIAATTGSGQVTQTFSIPTVAAGTYDLVVSKPGHLTYTVTNVVVGSTDLDLTVLTGKAYSTITLLAGDVNGDGTINSDDLNVIWNPANYFKYITAAGVDACADINGDGTINSDDLNIVWLPAHYMKQASQCEVNY